MTAVVRPLREDDIARTARLEKEIFSDAWSEASIRSHMAGAANVGLAAFVPGEDPGEADGNAPEAEMSREAAGYLLGMIVCDEAEVYRVAADPACRRQGIGSGLLRAFLDVCVSRGVKQVSLEVRAANDPAVRMYEKAGFAHAGLRKDYYRDPPDDGIVMRLEL